MISRQWLAVAAMGLIVGGAELVGLIALISSGQLMHRSGGQIIFLCAAGISAPVLAAWTVRRHPDEWTGPLFGAVSSRLTWPPAGRRPWRG